MLGVVDDEDEGGPRRARGEQLGQCIGQPAAGGVGPGLGVEEHRPHARGQLVQDVVLEGLRDERRAVAGDARALQAHGDDLGQSGGDEVEEGAASHAPWAVDRDRLSVEDARGDGGDQPGTPDRGGDSAQVVLRSEMHASSSVVGPLQRSPQACAGYTAGRSSGCHRGEMTSVPRKGCSALGTRTDPSACWWFSRIATIGRVLVMAVPLRVATVRVPPPSA